MDSTFKPRVHTGSAGSRSYLHQQLKVNCVSVYEDETVMLWVAGNYDYIHTAAGNSVLLYAEVAPKSWAQFFFFFYQISCSLCLCAFGKQQ